MGRALVGLATGLLLAVPITPLSGAVAVEADTVGQAASSAAARTHTDRERRYQRKVFHWTNVARRRHDLPPLHRIKCLRRIAVRWSEHLAASGDFEHQHLNVIFRRCDGARSAGENIDILVDGKVIGFGEIVIIEDAMGIRVTDFRNDD